MKHSFTVVAHNEAGDSDPSTASAEVLIDAAPEQMAAPTVVGVDGALDISWVKPNNSGSAIHTYMVFVNLPSGGQPISQSVSGSENSIRIGGLKNGELYSVSVQALNNAETPSPPSSPTASYPHGAPDPAGNVSAVPVGAGSDPNRATVEVSWSLGNSNGRGWGPTTVTAGRACRPVAGYRCRSC